MGHLSAIATVASCFKNLMMIMVIMVMMMMVMMMMMMTATDEGKIYVLLLLDVLVAFETQIILSRLETVFGIRYTAFQWLRSYLLDRNQSVVVKHSASSPSPLMFGVPQGSVLGPVLFVLHITPLSDFMASLQSTIRSLQTTLDLKNQLHQMMSLHVTCSYAQMT